METQLNGLKVDARKIAEGIYGMICHAGQDHIVSFGMIPHEFIECLERQLKVKLLELRPGMEPIDAKRQINEIVREVSVKIFAVASEKGAMRV